MYYNYISSLENKHIKHLKKIIDAPKKYRNYLVVEGEKHIQEFLKTKLHIPLRFFIIASKLRKFAYMVDDNYFIISDQVLHYLTDVDSSQGIIALFQINYDILNDNTITNDEETFIFDNIGDPGNLGTLIRTAAALGKNSVICVGGVFPFSPKVIRSSAGMIAHVRIIYFFEYSDSCKDFFSRKKIAVLNMGGENINDKISSLKYQNYSIVLGNEGLGINSFWRKNFENIALPMDSRVESLNVAIVGSIVGYLLWGR